MNGSEKQVAWAESIRDEYKTGLAAIEQMPVNPNATQAQLEMANKLRRVAEVADAAWWITNRHYLQAATIPRIAAVATAIARGEVVLP